MTAVGRPLHVVDTTMFWSPTGGGVRRYLSTKHAWLARREGWRHTIAVPLRAQPNASGRDDETARVAREEAGIESLPAFPIPRSGGYRLPWRRGAIADRLVALEPDLIEAGDPFVIAWSALDAARRRGIPAVAYCHSNVERMAGLFGGALFGGAAARAMRTYASRVYTRFDAVLAPSESMRRHLLEWGVARALRQPLGVDSAAFDPARRSPAWRTRAGFDADARVLVYVGRFAPEKHLDVLAAAVERLGAPYVLLCVGAGPAPPPARARVRVLPFVAGIDALATLLASADAFVHAGDQESFGLSVLEAMASGLPVVARRAEGLAELVDESVGVAVDDGTEAAFAEAIEALFARDLDPVRAAARRRALEHDWDRVLPKLLDVYTALIDPAAGAAGAPMAPLRSAPRAARSAATVTAGTPSSTTRSDRRLETGDELPVAGGANP